MPGEVRKAVFPVAGLGTRMLPMTRAVPKEMLPVADRPLVQYAVEEAVAAGISELVFVTDRSGPALEAHFGPAPELAGKTETGPGGERFDAARALVPPEVRLVFVPQGQPLGLGHAVWCAREAVGDAPFAVVLPDDLIVPGCLADLVETFQARGAAGVVAVEEVPRRDTARYGVVDVGGAAGPGEPDRVDRREAGPGGSSLEPRGGRAVRVRRLDHGDPRSDRARCGRRDPAHRRDREARRVRRGLRIALPGRAP